MLLRSLRIMKCKDDCGSKNFVLIAAACFGLISCQPPPGRDYNGNLPIIRNSPAKTSTPKIVKSTPTPLPNNQNSIDPPSLSPSPPNNLPLTTNSLPNVFAPDKPVTGDHRIFPEKLIIPVVGVTREQLRGKVEVQFFCGGVWRPLTSTEIAGGSLMAFLHHCRSQRQPEARPVNTVNIAIQGNVMGDEETGRFFTDYVRKHLAKA